jgi:hypothetical protein
LTLRTLQLSLFAMLSVLAVESPISSSSQRRPRAIEAISVARFSERIGRSFRNSAPAGKSISRRRVEFAFCHGSCGLEIHLLAFRELGLADQQFDRLCFAQRREDIHMGRKLSNRPSTLGNRGKDSNRALHRGQCQRWRIILSSKNSVLCGAMISWSHRTQWIPNMCRLFIPFTAPSHRHVALRLAI